MKNFLTFLILVLCFGCKSNQNLLQTETNVLLIGNSLTYYSDMPQMLQQMLNETHPNIKIHQSTFPGFSLDSHINNIIVSSSEDMVSSRKKIGGESTETEKKIKERQWDIIVLQTGTVNILIPEKRDIAINNAIKSIKTLSTNPECKYILFSTWASRTKYPKQYCYPCDDIDVSLGNADCCSPEFQNLVEYKNLINKGYSILAKKNDLTKSKHTDAVYDVVTNHPEINLYLDDIHPNKNGAFINACMFYQLLTNNKAKQLKYTGDIEDKTAKTLKNLSSKYL